MDGNYNIQWEEEESKNKANTGLYLYTVPSLE